MSNLTLLILLFFSFQRIWSAVPISLIMFCHSNSGFARAIYQTAELSDRPRVRLNHAGNEHP
jgi:hypothetical protein